MKEAKKKAVFISQPLNEKTGKVVLEEREAAIEKVRELLGEDVDIVDSLYSNRIVINHISCIGESISLMGFADVAFFAEGWQRDRGCRIEEACAREYGMKILYFSDKSV